MFRPRMSTHDIKKGAAPSSRLEWGGLSAWVGGKPLGTLPKNPFSNNPNFFYTFMLSRFTPYSAFTLFQYLIVIFYDEASSFSTVLVWQISAAILRYPQLFYFIQPVILYPTLSNATQIATFEAVPLSGINCPPPTNGIENHFRET